MSVPEHLWRFPTAAAINSLAGRFGLPHTSDMQDWEWQVADSERIDEFLDAYESGELTEDERFTLMETVIQSFENLEGSMAAHPRWAEFINTIKTNIDLHIYSVWYWSDLEDEMEEDAWQITPFLRSILMTCKDRFELKAQ